MVENSTRASGSRPSPSDPERRTGALVRSLGVASIALGAPLLARPDEVAEAIGADREALARPVLTGIGVQELATAALLLAGPTRSVWSRVAGDVVHLALLGRLVSGQSGERRSRATAATAAVVGITAVDLWASVRASRAQHGSGRPGPLELRASVTVNRPPQEVYDFWRDFTNLPTFMLHLLSVTTVDGTDGRRTRWEAQAPLGASVSWEAELTSEEPGRRISWKSLPGSRIDNAGTVHFAEAPGARGTEVSVVLHYDVPGGKVGRVVAKLLGEEPEQQVRDDLRRFKQVMETGRVVRSDGLPLGTDARHQAAQRPARPQPPEQARETRTEVSR